MPHSIEHLNLSQDTVGEILIPGELKDMVAPESHLRNFMLHVTRNYTSDILEHVPGMRVALHSEDSDVFGESSSADLVVVNLSFKPTGTLEEFVEESGDEFFDNLLKIVSYNDKRGLRGKRGVFVSEFARTNEDGVDVLSAKILLSTTVFYNDYRATVGYPSNQDEVDEVVEDIYNRLTRMFSEMEFEASGELVLEPENA